MIVCSQRNFPRLEYVLYEFSGGNVSKGIHASLDFSATAQAKSDELVSILNIKMLLLFFSPSGLSSVMWLKCYF